MADKTLTVLLLGDLCGHTGVRAAFFSLPRLVKEFKAEFVIANGENSAGGYGITGEEVSELFAMGVNVITTGNHVWQQEEVYPLLDSTPNLLRPQNYPASNPGHGYVITESAGRKIGVLNLQGRQSMIPIDCPFRAADAAIAAICKETPIIFVDFHAEETYEKEALAFRLDGKISALVGTHTHTQTADEKILPKGTAYISDLGMSGSQRSVIGGESEVSVRKNITQMPLRVPPAEEEAAVKGVAVTVDTSTGKAISITRF